MANDAPAPCKNSYLSNSNCSWAQGAGLGDSVQACGTQEGGSVAALSEWEKISIE